MLHRADIYYVRAAGCGAAGPAGGPYRVRHAGRAGLGGVWHHSRAHRFFAAAAWSADAVGLVVLRLAAGWLIRPAPRS